MTSFIVTSPETYLNEKLYAVGGYSVSTESSDAIIFEDYSDAERLAHSISLRDGYFSSWCVEAI